jgi:hypothetical protein
MYSVSQLTEPITVLSRKTIKSLSYHEIKDFVYHTGHRLLVFNKQFKTSIPGYNLAAFW